MLSCNTCNKNFTSALALAGHKRVHGQSAGKIFQVLCSCIYTRKVVKSQNLNKYQSNLGPCKQCKNLFRPTVQRKYFCSQSCSASFNNAARGPRSALTKAKISNSLKRPVSKKQKKNTVEFIGPYSKLFTCCCRHCKTKFVSRTKRQYCCAHRNLYAASSKAGYKFTFNVFNYPDLFDLDLLKRYGWFSPGGKSGSWNISGLSRDHRVSVTEAIANNYDPYYITHPINCELMPHAENNKKKTKSSISYCELKQLVDDYDKKSPAT